MITKIQTAYYLQLGLNIIGLSALKVPAEGSWKRYMTEFREPQDMKGEGVGIICGAISGNLEVIDIDSKHDLTTTLVPKYRSAVDSIDPELLKKLLIIRTPSGGFHWVYRCPKIQGNQKLAQRMVTKDEVEEKGSYKVLIETRGEGGYIASIPLPGYIIQQGSFKRIPTLSIEEREVLLSCAREFDERIDPVKIPVNNIRKSLKISSLETKTPGDDFDERGSIPEILIEAGWRFVYTDSDRQYFKRPGNSKAIYSGNFNMSLNCFKSFSSSTGLEPEKAYWPFALFTALLHDGDYSQSATALYKKGYGDRFVKEKQDFEQYNIEKEKSFDSDDLSKYYSDYENDYEYLLSVRNNTVQLGLSTGSKLIDEYFLFKRGTFTLAVGHTSVGKTLTLLWLTLLASLKNNWKCIIVCKENSSGDVRRNLMELYLQKSLTQTSLEEFKEANKWVNEHYDIIRGRGGLIKTLTDVMKLLYNMVNKKAYDLVLIDPYSGFDMEKKPGESTHEYNYRLLGEMLDFTDITKVSIFLSVHTVTSSRREKSEDGMLKRPYGDSSEGGSAFGNRCDTALVIHRKINADIPERYVTELYVEKDRNLNLGGSISGHDNPIKLRYKDNRFLVNSAEDVVSKIKDKGQIEQVELPYNEEVELPF